MLESMEDGLRRFGDDVRARFVLSGGRLARPAERQSVQSSALCFAEACVVAARCSFNSLSRTVRGSSAIGGRYSFTINLGN
jgi:hypothetical protein